MVAAMTAAVGVNTIAEPVTFSHVRPNALFTPKAVRRKYPITVGGITMGNVTIASTSARPRNFAFARRYAIAIPRTVATAVAIVATRRVIHNGNQSFNMG